jgi:ssDNA-binding Zn-finger/Zn-ribbon topoisomerase 1
VSDKANKAAKEAVQAVWVIELRTDCPACDEYFDLVESNYDWFVEGAFEICEHATDRTKGVDVECPNCGHEFQVDFEY